MFSSLCRIVRLIQVRVLRTSSRGPLIVVVLAACTTWKATPLTPEPGAGSSETRTLRVTLLNGDRYTLRHVRITADSVIGEVPSSGVPRSVARSEVKVLETSDASSDKTVGLLFGLGAIVVGIVVLAGLGGNVGY